MAVISPVVKSAKEDNSPVHDPRIGPTERILDTNDDATETRPNVVEHVIIVHSNGNVRRTGPDDHPAQTILDENRSISVDENKNGIPGIEINPARDRKSALAAGNCNLVAVELCICSHLFFKILYIKYRYPIELMSFPQRLYSR
jgi:hypothetical protein